MEGLPECTPYSSSCDKIKSLIDIIMEVQRPECVMHITYLTVFFIKVKKDSTFEASQSSLLHNLGNKSFTCPNHYIIVKIVFT